MERALRLTGIGGQGIQLAAQSIARGALIDGRHAQFFGRYGGAMRGGSSDCTVVVGDRPIEAPPLVSRAWSAIAAHHAYWGPVAPGLVDGAVVVVNATVFDAPLDRARWHCVEVPATELAQGEVGAAMTVSMVLTGAYAAATGLVALDACIEGMRQSVPSYRSQHVATNEVALRVGYAAVPDLVSGAWDGAGSEPAATGAGT